MIVEPTPYHHHERAEFRLPGYSGGAVFLRTAVLPPPRGVEGSPMLDLVVTVDTAVGFDLMLLASDWHCWFLGRRAEPGFVDRLAAFLFAAAADFEPQDTVGPVRDHVLGLEVAVEESSTLDVTLRWTVADDPLDPDEHRSRQTLIFRTSRSVVAAAARAARSLDGNLDHSPLEAYSL